MLRLRIGRVVFAMGPIACDGAASRWSALGALEIGDSEAVLTMGDSIAGTCTWAGSHYTRRTARAWARAQAQARRRYHHRRQQHL